MKCPNCHQQHRRKYGMICSCGYRFCLDPKTDGVTDGRLIAMARKASGNGTYHFTENQLFTVFRRNTSRSPVAWFALSVGLAVVAAALAVMQSPPAVFFALAAVVTFIVALARNLSRPPTRDKVRQWVGKWDGCGYKVDKLITRPRLHEPPPEWSEPDIYDYGVEGIVIVQRDLLVDLLVLNGFHATHRVLVVAETGYPEYLLPVARKCLEESPGLPVYLLHDADSAGLAMQERLRESDLLPLDGHAVLDLGITPDDVRNMKRLQVTRPERQDYAIPLDMIPYAILLAGLALALMEQRTLGELIAQHHAGTGDDTTHSFG